MLDVDGRPLVPASLAADPAVNMPLPKFVKNRTSVSATSKRSAPTAPASPPPPPPAHPRQTPAPAEPFPPALASGHQVLLHREHPRITPRFIVPHRHGVNFRRSPRVIRDDSHAHVRCITARPQLQRRHRQIGALLQVRKQNSLPRNVLGR